MVGTHERKCVYHVVVHAYTDWRTLRMTQPVLALIPNQICLEKPPTTPRCNLLLTAPYAHSFVVNKIALGSHAHPVSSNQPHRRVPFEYSCPTVHAPTFCCTCCVRVLSHTTYILVAWAGAFYIIFILNIHYVVYFSLVAAVY